MSPAGEPVPDDSGGAATASPAPAEAPRWDGRRAVIRLALALVGVFALMALLAKVLGPQIEGAGRLFVERFGIGGMVIGTFLADAFSVPLPPVFYIVVVATGSGSHVPGMAAICAASVCAGTVGYKLSGLLAARPFFRRRIDVTRARMDALMARHGVWAFAIASCSPFPFSFLCYVAGVYRVRPWLFALVCLLRIPRLLVLYWLVRAGWVTGAG